ncbi:GNAT family N-acetyltransferase [Tsukamurella sp. 8F]|uniref:GNAT family N-acetyltransferase n=1 Tax=unclassified Tsukamurella TaxID=2633480 RepID=UPI0023B9CF42|nr:MULTISPECIES: GNAT family N-acetyltransferase [unclassified Tsukamurella]MDF0532290.1 GNAT family N-acetyltransferase [Tsukamurella sp. 8J]MDF0589007.1 GNAT family N-acetyltransferase [Tsukamurella sp. 8F]
MTSPCPTQPPAAASVDPYRALCTSVESARLWLCPASTDGRFTIVDRHLRRTLGRISLRASRHSIGAGGLELSYAVAAPFRRRGFATEAAASLVGHAFAVTGTLRVYAHTALSNAASRHVLETLGMRQVEVAMHDWESLAEDVAAPPIADATAPDGLDLRPFARLEYEIDRETWLTRRSGGWAGTPARRPLPPRLSRQVADPADQVASAELLDRALEELARGRRPGQGRHAARPA